MKLNCISFLMQLNFLLLLLVPAPANAFAAAAAIAGAAAYLQAKSHGCRSI